MDSGKVGRFWNGEYVSNECARTYFNPKTLFFWRVFVRIYHTD